MGTTNQITKTKAIMPSICFVNAIAREVYSKTSKFDMNKLKQQICDQYGYNLENPIDQICTNMVLIKSILEN